MVPPLIAPVELAVRLAISGPPVVLDVRWALGGPPGIDAYRRGHVPGARFVDLETELSGTPGPGRHPLPDATAFAGAMRRHGVGAGRQVVVYDAATGMSAARAWWLLRFFGHPGVSVLDGGYAAWERAGLATSDGEGPAPEPGDFEATPGHMKLLDATAAAAVASAGVLVDVRARERFMGEVEPVDRVAGHIPGARNLPAAGNLDGGGSFLLPDELRRRWAEVGVAPGVEVGVYCGSGVVAAQGVLALAVAGIDSGLYLGSWSDWISDSSRPVARGG